MQSEQQGPSYGLSFFSRVQADHFVSLIDSVVATLTTTSLGNKNEIKQAQAELLKAKDTNSSAFNLDNPASEDDVFFQIYRGFGACKSLTPKDSTREKHKALLRLSEEP